MILLLLVTHIAAEHLAAAGGALRRSLNKKPAAALLLCVMELATKVRKDFTITEKAPYKGLNTVTRHGIFKIIFLLYCIVFVFIVL